MDQNYVQEEIKSRLKSGNVCYHSVQNILSSSLVSKNIKIKIYRTIILPVVLNGYENWLLTLREECGLKMFENRVVRRIFGPTMDEVTGEWRQLHNKLNDLSSSPNVIWVIKSRIINRWACSTNWGEERYIQDFDWETREKGPTWKTQAEMGG